MFRLAKLSVIPVVFLVGACENSGANYTPVIDGPVSANYNSDLAQCQSLAASQGTVNSETGAAALTGAALAGGTAALIDNTGSNARDAALVGAVAGGISSAAQNVSQKEVIVRNCMRSRGYNVVG
ncbi:hypothetical protein CLV78_102346 [Aliiruegeria haliotis]|uniref:Glycine zipper family protein n=1 Tax=Aliiruegeria haliotis TaxID=1280846 RepID=A0A2T0RVE2_9RHOB|nr:glycine zipper family protein [Aliiruegeria haliotis]PRY25169.1 hypothetical protein CLV78_102346 [Aliiruegeria haliotis]